MQATGGSRADGTVALSYSYTMFQTPVVDWTQATQTAIARCKAWDYSDAEAFGGSTSQCADPQCNTTIVTATFQCTGSTGP
ncbi:MAG: YecR family lipoprotein [Pseudohongiella sp.]|nr:YecR family lipoprotein [Pseudohongiella sp.]